MQPGAPVEGNAETAYRQWLARQYAAFLESLRGLIRGGAPPAVQVRLLPHKLLPPSPAHAPMRACTGLCRGGKPSQQAGLPKFA